MEGKGSSILLFRLFLLSLLLTTGSVSFLCSASLAQQNRAQPPSNSSTTPEYSAGSEQSDSEVERAGKACFGKEEKAVARFDCRRSFAHFKSSHRHGHCSSSQLHLPAQHEKTRSPHLPSSGALGSLPTMEARASLWVLTYT